MFSISLINQKWFNQFQVFFKLYEIRFFFKAILYFFAHTYFKGPILAINKPLTMTFASIKLLTSCLLIVSKVVVKFRYRLGLGMMNMEDQRALRFNKKYLILCSEDEWRSYGFGTKLGWVIS